MTPLAPPGQAFFLVGPTASGKTDAAHRLALETGTEVLSADSMLVYRGMDIGSAKPDQAQQREVRYWGLDLVEIGEPFSLALYRQAADQAIRENARRGRGLIVAGGTGLYVRALIEGLDPGPPPDPALRRRWEERVARGGVDELLREIQERFPGLASSLTESDRGNPRRLIRALERGEAGLESRPRGWVDPSTLPPVTGLLVPPPVLRARIEKRVERMYAQGFLEEVQGLLARGLADSPTACHAIGYSEAIACLQGRARVPEAQAATVKRTWQLARRQMTWFRHQSRVRWIPFEADLPPDAVADRVREAWRETGPLPLHGPV